MQQQTPNTTKAIRFRRWSRTRFAIFASLSCTVTIGVLNAAISEKSLKKAENAHQIVYVENKLSNDDEHPESSLATLSFAETTILNAQLNFTINQTLDNAAACDLIFYKPLSTVEAGNSCFNRFLF